MATGRQPPRPDDVRRLAANGSRVAITAIPDWGWDDNPDDLPRPESKNDVLRLIPSPERSDHARRNAVAVALDHTGRITRLVLAGEAALYSDSEP